MSKRLWDTFLKEVDRTVDHFGCHDPFFRGHKKSAWKLKPALGRKRYRPNVENRLYFRFDSLSKHLIPENATSWDILFYMQHHGLPTRLLDWTVTFSVALFFAVSDATYDRHDGAIWILNPYKLNGELAGKEVLHSLNYFDEGFDYYFHPDSSKKFPASALAIDGKSLSQRMRSQRGVFTLHRNLRDPLERLAPDCLKKIILPAAARSHAKHFLKLSGINEFSIYPDLDGLGAYLKREEC